MCKMRQWTFQFKKNLRGHTRTPVSLYTGLIPSLAVSSSTILDPTLIKNPLKAEIAKVYYTVNKG